MFRAESRARIPLAEFASSGPFSFVSRDNDRPGMLSSIAHLSMPHRSRCRVQGHTRARPSRFPLQQTLRSGRPNSPSASSRTHRRSVLDFLVSSRIRATGQESCDLHASWVPLAIASLRSLDPQSAFAETLDCPSRLVLSWLAGLDSTFPGPP